MTPARLRITCKPRHGETPTGADIDLAIVLPDQSGSTIRLPANALRIEADASGKPIRVQLDVSDAELDLDLPADVIERLGPQEPAGSPVLS